MAPVPLFGGPPDPHGRQERGCGCSARSPRESFHVLSSDSCYRHLLLLADLVEQLHVLHHSVRRAVDAVVLGAKDGRDARSVVPHEALHELHQQVPAVVGYHAGAVLHLPTQTTALKRTAGAKTTQETAQIPLCLPTVSFETYLVKGLKSETSFSVLWLQRDTHQFLFL